MKKLLSLILAAVMLLSLAACGGNPDTPSTEPSTEPSGTTGGEVTTVSYTYEFEGMMGKEKAQIDLLSDGTCKFFLPDHPMIKDVYAGTYTVEGNVVTIQGLTNVDTASEYKTPGLWDWIVDGNATVTVDATAGTFAPVA